MSNAVRHPYHLVDESPWPLASSGAAFFLVAGLLEWFMNSEPLSLFLGLMLLLSIMGKWWMDVSREGSHLGQHSVIVQAGLRWGMVLFITSEVFFFLSFFWAFFHSSVSPSSVVGGVWPPMGIQCFNPEEIPLLNTLILLSSGVTVTWSHHALMSGNHSNTVWALGMTLMLGIYFTFLQGVEYYEAGFSFAEGIYGSTFYLATGFHGLHVLVGSAFLGVCLIRIKSGKMSCLHHLGFEAAAWYWHFVDVVWLFLFVSIYYWSKI